MSSTSGNHDPTLDGFALPDYQSDVDFDAYINAVSEGATLKGMIFLDLIESIRTAQPERVGETELAQRRYLPFSDYSQKDYLRLVQQTCEIVHPRVPSAEAVRRLAGSHFSRFADSVIGRVVFGIFFDDIDRLIPAVAKAIRYLVTPATVDSIQIGERNWRYELRSMPGTLEPLWAGATEGMLRHYDLEPIVLLKIFGPGNLDFSVRWTEP